MLTSQFVSLASVEGVESEFRFLIIFLPVSGQNSYFILIFCGVVTVEGLWHTHFHLYWQHWTMWHLGTWFSADWVRLNLNCLVQPK